MLDSIRRYVYIVYQLFKWMIYGFLTSGESDSMVCLVGKTAIVTGGNSGIGYAVSTKLASRGCRVIIADVADSEISRNSIIDRTKNKNILSKHLDLSSLESVRKFANEINRDEEKIDILINNAGIAATATKCTEDGLNTMMQVNIFGAFLLTHLLIERLQAAKDARVVFTGSFMAFFSRMTLYNIKEKLNPVEYELGFFTECPSYQDSKLCNILVAQKFTEKLRKYDIIVNSVDPGIVQTKLIYLGTEKLPCLFKKIIPNLHIGYRILKFLGQDTFKGAQTFFHIATSEKLKESGQHFFRCKSFNKPEILENEKFCNEVWKRMEKLVKLKPEEKL